MLDYADTAGVVYAGKGPALIAASSDAAMRRAERGVLAAGVRVGAKMPIEAAVERLRSQARVSAVWIEVDRDGGQCLDELLDRINDDVADGAYGAVVSTTPELLDPIIARVGAAPIEVVVNGGDHERIAALATCLALDEAPRRVADVGSDQSAERLRQLSDEVSRIASALARLSTGPTPIKPQAEPIVPTQLAPLAADTVRKVIRSRRLRTRFFDETLFADPAWDMMLDLLQSEIEQHRVPVSSLCIAAAVPATTALRWLKTLVAQGLFVRRADPHDGRRVFVELAPQTSASLRRYFAEVGQPIAI